jgi:carotenoid cleavage dioxygenase-like enzyme
MDLKTGKGTERRITHLPGDFPVIDSSLLGRKNRFFYYVSLVGNPGSNTILFKNVVKYDRVANVVSVHTPQDGMHCGEFVFVPRSNRNPKDEDDGYLVSFCHNGKTNQSEFYIIDAKTMAENPVARVSLPQRVPWGFHGLWFDQKNL